MANKARRRPSWKKNPNRFVKEVYQETLVIYGEDIDQFIQSEIDREILASIKLSDYEWWSPEGKGVITDGPVIDFRIKDDEQDRIS
jgi:hypothetical protein